MRANPGSLDSSARLAPAYACGLKDLGGDSAGNPVRLSLVALCLVGAELLCRCPPLVGGPPGGKIVRRLRMDVAPAHASKTRSCSMRKIDVGSRRRPNREKDEFHFFAWSDLNRTVTRLLGLGHDLDQRIGGQTRLKSGETFRMLCSSYPPHTHQGYIQSTRWSTRRSHPTRCACSSEVILRKCCGLVAIEVAFSQALGTLFRARFTQQIVLRRPKVVAGLRVR